MPNTKECEDVNWIRLLCFASHITFFPHPMQSKTVGKEKKKKREGERRREWRREGGERERGRGEGKRESGGEREGGL
jgi:hypothetical protein